MALEHINPRSLGEARGWTNGMLAPVASRTLYVDGQTARDAAGR